jgi:hypothetical protein
MYRADAFLKLGESSLRPGHNEIAMDYYQGVELAPNTLVTWDVSASAQREQDRLNSARPIPGAMQGDY